MGRDRDEEEKVADCGADSRANEDEIRFDYNLVPFRK